MLPSLKLLANETLGVPWSIIGLVGGILLMLLGGHWLVEGAVTLARRMGVSALVIGMTVVAFGTSAPELALNVIAAIDGETSLAFGNVVGSNIANIGLVLGLSALAAPLMISSRIIRLELPWLIVVTLVFLLLAWLPPGVEDEAGYNRIDGILLLLGSLFICLQWHRRSNADTSDALATESTSDIVPGENKHLKSGSLSTAILLSGLILLMIGGKAAEEGAVAIAEHLGVSDLIIGLTIVAIATTLPEIITCIIATRRGHSDLAVGTVVGSNLFNIVLVMGVTSIVHPVAIPGNGWWSLAALLVFTMLLLPLARSARTLSRIEGIALLMMYLGFLVGSTWLELGTAQG